MTDLPKLLMKISMTLKRISKCNTSSRGANGLGHGFLDMVIPPKNDYVKRLTSAPVGPNSVT